MKRRFMGKSNTYQNSLNTATEKRRARELEGVNNAKRCYMSRRAKRNVRRHGIY